MLTIHDYETPSEKTWYLIITGMRNSWESHDKSDSFFSIYEDRDFSLGAKDEELALRLIKAGNDHGKFLRQLPIVIDFSAPEYFLKEFDTYKVGTTRNSTSMMHTLGKYPFSSTMFSWEDTIQHDVVNSTLTTLNYLRDNWIEEGARKKGPEASAWRAMVQFVPQSWIYRSMWTGNYQVLRSMYLARKAHRLQEWRTFCGWVETLPYAELLTQN